jgi:hypothetical protein
MRKGFLFKSAFVFGTFSFALCAFGLSSVSPQRVSGEASSSSTSSTVLGLGSTFYAFVPTSWTANGRFSCVKFGCYGTNSSNAVAKFELYSQSVSANACPANSAIYKMASVASSTLGTMTNVLTCTIPSTATGYSNVIVTGVQLMNYAGYSGTGSDTRNWATSTNWDTSSAVYGSFNTTTGSSLVSNYLQILATAATGSKPLASSYSTFGAYSENSASLDYWSSLFVSTLTSTCNTTKTAAQNDSAAASSIYQLGWVAGTFGKTGYDSLALKSSFTAATANYQSTSYVERAAALYDYIEAKYVGTTYLSNWASRTINTFTPGSAKISLSSTDSASALVLGGLATIAVLAAGSYFFIRKKKVD